MIERGHVEDTSKTRVSVTTPSGSWPRRRIREKFSEKYRKNSKTLAKINYLLVRLLSVHPFDHPGIRPIEQNTDNFGKNPIKHR